MKAPAIAPTNESAGWREGAVTRPAGRREYVRVGSTAAFSAADTFQSSNRTFRKIRKLFTTKSLPSGYEYTFGVGQAQTQMFSARFRL